MLKKLQCKMGKGNSMNKESTKNLYKNNDIEELLWYAAIITEAKFDSCPSLFHYTSREVADKILAENKISLKFSKAKDFEDSKEGKHIEKILREICDELFCLEEKKLLFYKAIFEAIESNEEVSDLKESYVFCFSKEENNPYLKENYACRTGRNGTIVGIQTLALEDICYDHSSNLVFLYDVIYDRDKIKEPIKHAIKKAFELRRQDDIDFSTTKKIIHSIIRNYGLVYKGMEFSEEKESRMVIYADHIDENDVLKKHGNDLFLTLPENALYCRIDL